MFSRRCGRCHGGDGLGFYIARNDAAAMAKGVKRMFIPIRSTKSAERRRKQEALVPQQLEVTHRVRGAHLRGRAPTGAQLPGLTSGLTSHKAFDPVPNRPATSR